MSSKDLNEFSKDTILKAIENNWLVKKELNNIIGCCYDVEIDKANKEYIKILEAKPQEPATDDFKSTIRHMQEIRSHIQKCEKCFKKLEKLRNKRQKHWSENNG